MADKFQGLPKNAYTELKSGEVYKPIIPSDKVVPEITIRSVGWGIFMAFLFSAAAAYLGLKVGQVFEAAIPIAILAVGLGTIYKKRRSTILENVIIQSIGAASGVIVAGSIFTLPAIYILGLDQKIGVDILKLFLVSLFGGVLGILFLIPFRKYFVSDMHGKFPFPEATATTEVLVTGEKGADQAKILLFSAGFAGIMDFLIYTLHTWPEVVTSRVIASGQMLADKFKMVFRLDLLASIVGLGYIIGLRYSAVIVAGSFLSWFVLVPLVFHMGNTMTTVLPPADGMLIVNMTAEEIFKNYVRIIGIGAIAAAGLIGVLKSSKVIVAALTRGFKEMFAHKSVSSKTVRTDKDIKMATVFLALSVTAILMLIFFRFMILSPIDGAWRVALIAFAIVLIISFLFTSVAARAIAIVGTNPISGMTLMTLILSSVILLSVGLKGDFGMYAALMIGGVVCTALSMAGGFITDLKIGYWIGSTPWNQERFKFIGVLVSSISVVLMIILLNDKFGFVATPEHKDPLVAPQANAMATVLKSLLSTETVPWMLLGIGVMIAIVLELAKVPALAFALGMYIPQELNVPLIIGGFIAYLVAKSTKDEKLSTARKDKGTLIASGFIAGGAIMGVFSTVLKAIEIKGKSIEDTLSGAFNWADKPIGEVLGFVAFALVIAYLLFVSLRIKKTKT